jgi:hypothetical protein
MPAACLFACSGDPAAVYRMITEAQVYGRTLLLISAAITVFAVALMWFRPPAIIRTFLMIVVLFFHPAIWDNGAHGDCGDWLRRGSTIWLCVIVVLALAVVMFPLRRNHLRRPPNSMDAARF